MCRVDVVITGGRVLTCAEPVDQPLQTLDAGVIGIVDGRVAFVENECPPAVSAARRVDVGGRLVTPGLVDCHTHAIFAGSRAREFALRAAGASYLEIAAKGGGISASTVPTRAASEAQLAALCSQRLDRALAGGTTTVEVKSGYDLTVSGELRLLRILQSLRGTRAQQIVPTFLCHLVPADRAADRAAYVEELAAACVPEVARSRLATSVDVYCDQGAFTLEETSRLLGAARKHGLDVRAHIGQFADLGGAELLAQLGARSIDHVENISATGIEAIARAGTVAVMLPGAAVSLRLPPPPVARLRAAGVLLAVGTDLNPGSSYCETLPVQMWLAATHYGMTIDEVWRGVTCHAARAIGAVDDGTGTLAPGSRADLCVWDAEHPADIAYRYGAQAPDEVWVAGDRVR